VEKFMGLFSKKPKPAATKAAAAPLAPPHPTSGAPKPAPASAPAATSKGKKGSVDPTDFLALRHEMMDLKARLEASEQAKAIVEARLAALDATTTAMATERPVSDELSARVSDLQAQLDAVAETVATTASAPVEPAPATVAPGPDPELVARIDALSAHLETVSSVGAPDPTIETRLEALTAKVEAGTTPDPGLLARLDQLSARVENTPDAARLVELEARLGELAAKADQPAPIVAAVAAEPDPETIARLDELAERVAAVDAFGSQLAQLNARVTAQAEFGAQLGSLRDRITELSNDTEDRRAAAFAATGEADLRDRVNAIADRLGSTEGIAAQMALLAERVAANDTTTRQAAEQVAAVEQRLNSVSTELANQVSELGRDIDGLAAQSNEVTVSSVSDEVIETLKTSQVKLAAEQARYEIAFRQDLAALAEQVRRQS
jgi:tetrahydromethanopterin S-methyltransferase subunit G